MILIAFIGLLYLVVAIALWQLILDMSEADSRHTRLKSPPSSGQDGREHTETPPPSNLLRNGQQQCLGRDTHIQAPSERIGQEKSLAATATTKTPPAPQGPSPAQRPDAGDPQ